MNEDCCSSFASSYDNSLENIGAHDSFVAYGQGWAEAGMAPFSGIKSAMAEGGVRVAAFANHSSLHNAGRVSQTYLTMQDVMPTLLCQAIALGAAATGMGLNQFAWAQDDNKSLPRSSASMCRSGTSLNSLAIRTRWPGRWRKAEILLQRLPTTPAC